MAELQMLSKSDGHELLKALSCLLTDVRGQTHSRDSVGRQYLD